MDIKDSINKTKKNFYNEQTNTPDLDDILNYIKIDDQTILDLGCGPVI